MLTLIRAASSSLQAKEQLVALHRAGPTYLSRRMCSPDLCLSIKITPVLRGGSECRMQNLVQLTEVVNLFMCKYVDLNMKQTA